MLTVRFSNIGRAGRRMAKTVGLSCVELQVLSQLRGYAGTDSDDVGTPFGVLAQAWKLGTVHQLVNALLTLVDKGMLRQCDSLAFCLTEKGRAAMGCAADVDGAAVLG
jgi:hypothetical protein